MIGWFKSLSMGKRVAVGLAAVIALIAAVTALILAINAHDAAQRQAGRDEVMRDWNAEKAARASAVADFQIALGKALQPRFDALATQIGAIDGKAATIAVELPRALAADPRYADPRCDLTVAARDQINAARTLSSEEVQK